MRLLRVFLLSVLQRIEFESIRDLRSFFNIILGRLGPRVPDMIEEIVDLLASH